VKGPVGIINYSGKALHQVSFRYIGGDGSNRGYYLFSL